MGSDDARPPSSAGSLDVARRVLTRHRGPGAEGEVGGLQRACSQVTETLRDSLGEAGCSALLARALLRTEAAHPSVQQIRRSDANTIQLDGVAASIEAHGLPAVTAAIEALLVALLEILTQLIGADMAERLIDHDGRQPGSPGGATP